MPIFTLGKVTHPSFKLKTCFRVDIWLPLEEVGDVVVSGYVSEEFTVPVMSKELASLFAKQPPGGFAEVNVVFETRFQGDLYIHRTEQLGLRFKIAPPSQGQAYFHLPIAVLAQFFDLKLYTARERAYDFVAMHLHPDFCCSEIPIER